MAKRGTKPTPTAIKKARGDKRGINPNEPMPEPSIPTCPPHLNDYAIEEWNRLAPSLCKLRVLTAWDRGALAAYCDSFGRWREYSEKRDASGGVVVQAPSGYPVKSPFASAAEKAYDQMLKAAAEFGLTPSSRSRVQTTPKKRATTLEPGKRDDGPIQRPAIPALRVAK